MLVVIFAFISLSLGASPDLRLLAYTAGPLNTFTVDHVIVAKALSSHVQFSEGRCLFTLRVPVSSLQINPEHSRQKAGFIGKERPLAYAQFQLYLADHFYPEDVFVITLKPIDTCLESDIAQIELIGPKVNYSVWSRVSVVQHTDGPVLRAHLKLNLNHVGLKAFSNLSHSVRVEDTVDLILTLPFSFPPFAALPLVEQNPQNRP